MDRTVLEHTILSVVFTGIGFLLGDITAGAAFSVGVFLSREIAQAEYRWIEKYGHGLRDNMPWHGPFQARAWDVASVCDVLVPTVAVGIILIVKGLL